MKNRKTTKYNYHHKTTSTNTTTTNEEIESLINEFDRLTTHLSIVTDKLKQAGRIDEQGRLIEDTQQHNRSHRVLSTEELVIGDRVEVRNNYKGRRGIQGVVTGITPTQAYVEPDNGGETFRSHKSNLRLIN